jgi:uncharacterized protein
VTVQLDSRRHGRLIIEDLLLEGRWQAMQINVAQLLRASIGSVKDYEVKKVIDITGDGVNDLVQGKVRLTRTNRSILVKGALEADVELTCSRCLGPFRRSLKVNLEEEYYPTADVDTGAAIAVPDEPGCFTIDQNHILDLTEAVRQYALLAVPMKPLCRENCAGLCPFCGQNLNRGPCGCPPKAADPRWSELSKLKKEKGK